MVYKFFDENSATLKGTGIISENQQLAEELLKPSIRKFKKHKVCCSFKDNLWVADLADMQSINRYNKEIRFLLCVIDAFTKYPWFVSLKEPNQIWVDKGSEFYIRSMKL